MSMHTPTLAVATGSSLALRAALVLVSLLGSLLLAEAVARRLEPAVPTSVVPIYRASDVPGVQYTLIPSLDTRALGADLRTNSIGFRGREWEQARTDGTLRVVLIGDSHAFGFGVDFAATVGEVAAGLLRERLGRPVEVLNFAVNGYNAAQQLAVLRAFALDYHPDVVVLMPCNNDDEPGPWASRDGYLVARPDDRGAPPAGLGVLRSSALVGLARRVVAHLGDPAPDDGRAAAAAATAPASAGAAPSGADPDPPPAELERVIGVRLRR